MHLNGSLLIPIAVSIGVTIEFPETLVMTLCSVDSTQGNQTEDSVMGREYLWFAEALCRHGFVGHGSLRDPGCAYAESPSTASSFVVSKYQ
jgi:hypothetical protein